MRADLGMEHVEVLGVDVGTWSERYGLETFSVRCETCGEEVRVDVPFAGADGVRGLCARPCPCGDPNAPHTYVGGRLDSLG